MWIRTTLLTLVLATAAWAQAKDDEKKKKEEEAKAKIAEFKKSLKGVYDDERGVVFINRKITEGHGRAVTVAHELGHAFGLPHVVESERASLMNPANTSIEPTGDDVAALRALWGNCADR